MIIAFMNTRIYNAFPTAYRSILKKVRIPSTAGNGSSEIVYSDDYVFAPAIAEVYNMSQSPYGDEGTLIPWFTNGGSRVKFVGQIVPPDSQVYTMSTDPSSASSNDVKAVPKTTLVV